MHRLPRLPARFPAGTKYVLEARGPWVDRFIEYPDGRRMELNPRKAATCDCAEQTLVPTVNLATRPKRRRVVEAA
jgi:hypothetical protein